MVYLATKIQRGLPENQGTVWSAWQLRYSEVCLAIKVQLDIGLVSKVQCTLPGNQGTALSTCKSRYNVVCLTIKVQRGLPGNVCSKTTTVNINTQQ